MMGCNHSHGYRWLIERDGLAECLSCGTEIFVEPSTGPSRRMRARKKQSKPRVMAKRKKPGKPLAE